MIKTYLRNIVRSFYDAALYREAITEQKGFGGLHMLFVSAFVGLLVTGMLGVSLYTFKKEELPYLAKQIPPIYVKDHQISSPADQPYLITTKNENFKIVIDTKSSALDLYKHKAEIIVGKDIILMRQINGYKPITLEDTKDRTYTRKTFEEFFNKIYYVLLLAWPLLTGGQWVGLITQVFVVAVASYAVTAAMREEYYFETRMRLAALAMTPPFIISKVTALFINDANGTPFIKAWLAVLLALLYFYVMIMLTRRLDGPVSDTVKPQ